jgi:hypothetical protein
MFSIRQELNFIYYLNKIYSLVAVSTAEIIERERASLMSS